jgi:hypothetical protein
MKDKSKWENQTYKMTERLEDVRGSIHCVPSCILVSYNAGERPKERPQNTWVEMVQKFRRKEKLNGAQIDLQLQTARVGRISVNPLHLPVEEILLIEENICRLRLSP